MRQNPPNKEAIKRMVNFLIDVKKKCEGEYANKSFSQLQIEHSISRSSFKSCVEFECVVTAGEGDEAVYIWNDEYQPGRKLALAIMDLNLHKNKKQVHVPLLPELATAVNLLNKVADKLDLYTLQNESILKRLKMPSNEAAPIQGENLFSEADQYHKDFVYLAGQMVAALYANTYRPPTMDDQKTFAVMNDRVIVATTDLLTKINNLKTTKNGQ